MWFFSSPPIWILQRGLWLQALLLLGGLHLAQDPVVRDPVVQDPGWSSLLEQGEYVRAGRSLGEMPAQTSFKDLGAAGLRLLRLDLPSARLVQRGLRGAGAGQGRVSGFLTDLIAAHRGDPLPLLPRIQALLEDESSRTAVLSFLGRGALQLCRSGRSEGGVLLRRVLALYPGASWAMSNLANGYRFLGQYGQAIQLFEQLIGKHGRQAWFLNGLALVHQARFEYDKALALFLEAGADGAPGEQADRFTARTNAAILLIARQGKGDWNLAEQLLDLVVTQDPVAIRAPYYLRRIQRLREASSRR